MIVDDAFAAATKMESPQRGAWIGVRLTPEMWAKHLRGELTGLSLAGKGQRADIA